MSVDRLTGMPEVSDGAYWVVEDEMDYTFSFAGWGYPTGRLQVKLIRDVVTTHIATTGKWVKRSTTVTETRQERLAGPVRVQGVHPIAVRNAAFAALKKYEKDQAREALKGIYPPKRLVFGS